MSHFLNRPYVSDCMALQATSLSDDRWVNGLWCVAISYGSPWQAALLKGMVAWGHISDVRCDLRAILALLRAGAVVVCLLHKLRPPYRLCCCAAVILVIITVLRI